MINMMTLEEINQLPGNTSSERLWREIAGQLAQANIYLKELTDIQRRSLAVQRIQPIETELKKVVSRTPLTEK